MAIALCFIAGLIGAALVMAAFIGGFYMGKHDTADGVTLDKGNAEAIRSIQEWMNYRG